jgi:hypothetical protein
MTNIGLKPLRKVLKCEDDGFFWTLTLECGHVFDQAHPAYGDPTKLNPPKSKRCGDCFRASGGGL